MRQCTVNFVVLQGSFTLRFNVSSSSFFPILFGSTLVVRAAPDTFSFHSNMLVVPVTNVSRLHGSKTFFTPAYNYTFMTFACFTKPSNPLNLTQSGCSSNSTVANSDRPRC
ncbi:hypothetical protein BDR05DRAFT_154961 [Suillus weaverae]|nr:hypothetical protein BDR05DRAFT_154961 [Suillus weaverae]